MGSLKPCSLVALKPFCYWTPLVTMLLYKNSA